MSASAGSRASELAAKQVEQIVAAAQEAAEEMRKEARVEQEDIRRWAEEDSEELRKEARRDVERMLEQARKQAIVLGSDARREAQALLDDAKEEALHRREQTQRAVEGRVAAAEKAAADVLEEARALSGGLRQLGKSLEDYAERILRDVQAAHKRMQAELRVTAADKQEALSGLDSSRTAETGAAPASPQPAATGARPGAGPRRPPAGEPDRDTEVLDGSERSEEDGSSGDGDDERRRRRGSVARRPGRKALEEFDVPSWVEPTR